MSRRLLPALAFACLATACADDSGANGASGGTIIVAAPSDPGTLVPALAASNSDQAVAQQLFDRLADIGDDLNTLGDRGFRPRLARSWTWSADSLSIEFMLDPRARWHDGRPVTARDVRFTWELYHDTTTHAPFAPLIAGIDSVSVRDSLTAVFWFHRRTPEQFFDATYQMLVHPEHLLGKVRRDSLEQSAFARAPVGTGRFRFVQFEPKVKLVLASDTTNFRGRAKVDRVIFVPVKDGATQVNQMLTREADVVENVRPEMVARLAGNPDVKVLTYATLSYGYLTLALHDKGTARPHPVFGEPAMRRAVARALDRVAIAHAIFDSLATVPSGPAPSAIAPHDTSLRQWPYDPVEADRLLDSLGWTRGADGMRARGRTPLAFSVMVPTTSATRTRVATLIQAALKERGIAVTVDAVEPAVYSPRINGRAFDAVIQTVATDPTLSTTRQTWGGAGALAPNGSNHAGYANPAFDAVVDSAAANGDPAGAQAQWARAWRIINADAPAIWLFEPRTIMALHRRLQPQGINPTAWWAGLADWTIPAGQRLARDRASAGR
ncbi:MAG: peptide ABC transporter substrate-binding protein [Gemmatimonadetes bacterium]|nr:peptide ABC transporter substrate-binding protein [Gemmatimonadota bacterium]